MKAFGRKNIGLEIVQVAETRQPCAPEARIDALSVRVGNAVNGLPVTKRFMQGVGKYTIDPCKKPP